MLVSSVQKSNSVIYSFLFFSLWVIKRYCINISSPCYILGLVVFVQSHPTLCDPMGYSTPGFPVHHQLTELAQTHVHQVGDAIQPSHPLLSPSSAFNLSQHQGLFHWIGSLHQVAKVLELQLQHQSIQWIFRIDVLAAQGTLKNLLLCWLCFIYSSLLSANPNLLIYPSLPSTLVTISLFSMSESLFL